jgi:hypothetical protein
MFAPLFPVEAGAILRKRNPFVPLINVRRRYSVRQMLTGFVRDGFIDRCCGARLVCVAALRLIAFWELVPTLDHILPVSRGGTDDESNWAISCLEPRRESWLWARRRRRALSIIELISAPPK